MLKLINILNVIKRLQGLINYNFVVKRVIRFFLSLSSSCLTYHDRLNQLYNL